VLYGFYICNQGSWWSTKNGKKTKYKKKIKNNNFGSFFFCWVQELRWLLDELRKMSQQLGPISRQLNGFQNQIDVIQSELRAATDIYYARMKSIKDQAEDVPIDLELEFSDIAPNQTRRYDWLICESVRGENTDRDKCDFLMNPVRAIDHLFPALQYEDQHDRLNVVGAKLVKQWQGFEITAVNEKPKRTGDAPIGWVFYVKRI